MASGRSARSPEGAGTLSSCSSISMSMSLPVPSLSSWLRSRAETPLPDESRVWSAPSPPAAPGEETTPRYGRPDSPYPAGPDTDRCMPSPPSAEPIPSPIPRPACGVACTCACACACACAGVCKWDALGGNSSPFHGDTEAVEVALSVLATVAVVRTEPCHSGVRDAVRESEAERNAVPARGGGGPLSGEAAETEPRFEYGADAPTVAVAGLAAVAGARA